MRIRSISPLEVELKIQFQEMAPLERRATTKTKTTEDNNTTNDADCNCTMRYFPSVAAVSAFIFASIHMSGFYNNGLFYNNKLQPQQPQHSSRIPLQNIQNHAAPSLNGNQYNPFCAGFNGAQRPHPQIYYTNQHHPAAAPQPNQFYFAVNNNQRQNDVDINPPQPHQPNPSIPIEHRVTPPAKKSKPSTVSLEELKHVLFKFVVSGRPHQNLKAYCDENELERAVYCQILRFLQSNPVLKDLIDQRNEEEKMDDALNMINDILPGPELSPETFITDDYFTPNGLRQEANKLDFSARPRKSRSGDESILVHKKKNMDERTKSLTLLLYNTVLGQAAGLSAKERQAVFKDAATIVMYDQGYEQVRGITKLNRTWYQRLLKYFRSGNGRTPLQSEHKGRFSYRDKIESEHPGYITELYRKAEKLIGFQATFPAMASKINELSRTTPYSDKPDLFLTASHLRRHFRQCGGKLKSPVEKPYKTKDQNRETLRWMIKMKQQKRQLGNKFHICYLDEKWFYTTSRRRKFKVLPPQPNEDPSKVPTYRKTCISRRHPTKVMALGVCAPPCEANGFNGSIFFKRVSKKTTYQQMSHNQNLSDDAWMNGSLKDGDWKSLHTDMMTWGELKDLIVSHYDIDDGIAERLVLRYVLNADDPKRRKCKYITSDNYVLTETEILLTDYTLMARYNAGDVREEDCSCDSDFMLPTMDEVGEAIRSRYRENGVSFDEVIFLVMDNAGGHGKKEVIEQYEQHLKNKYNITIVWQQPRTPESNMLDLGVWMHVQHKVEEKHFGLRSETEALWRSMQAAWDDLSQQALTNVYERWLKVIDLTIKAEGSNHLVETERGRLFTVPSAEAEMVGDDAEEEVDIDGDHGEDALLW